MLRKAYINKLILKYKHLVSFLADDLHSVGRHINGYDNAPLINKPLGSIAAIQACIGHINFQTLSGEHSRLYKNTILSESLLSSVAHVTTVFSEYLGNFSNTHLFRHFNIKDRRISILNQKLPGTFQLQMSSKLKVFENSMYELYSDHFLSSKPDALRNNVVGFIKKKSYIDHARAHVNSKAIVSIDISKFYDSISLRSMISNGLFYRSLCASFKIRTGKEFHPSSFAKEIQYAALDRLFVIANMLFMTLMSFYTHNGLLPTGSSYSPIVSNILFASLDLSIKDLLANKGVIYTRYADDICISTANPYNDDGSFKLTMDLVLELEKIVKSGGFHLNYDKTLIMGPRDKKKVAGIIIDQSSDKPKLSIGSKKKLELRVKYENTDWKTLTPSDKGLLNWVRDINGEQFNFIAAGIQNVPSKFWPMEIINKMKKSG